MRCRECGEPIGAMGAYVLDEVEDGSGRRVYYHLPCYRRRAQRKHNKGKMLGWFRRFHL